MQFDQTVGADLCVRPSHARKDGTQLLGVNLGWMVIPAGETSGEWNGPEGTTFV